jgi:hypothetical protein
MRTGRWASPEDVEERRSHVAELWGPLQGNLRAIARRLADDYGVKVSEKLIREDREALGLTKTLQGRRLTEAELEEQRVEATRLHVEEGWTGEEIGAKLGISGTAAIRLIPEELRRPSGRRCDEPAPEPRRCAYVDGDGKRCPTIVVPKRWQLRQGDGRFCSEHFQQSPEKREATRQRDLERHRRAREQFEQFKQEHDLPHEVRDLAKRWDVSGQEVSSHYVNVPPFLRLEAFTFEGVSFLACSEAEAVRFESDWVRKGWPALPQRARGLGQARAEGQADEPADRRHGRADASTGTATSAGVPESLPRFGPDRHPRGTARTVQACQCPPGRRL